MLTHVQKTLLFISLFSLPITLYAQEPASSDTSKQLQEILTVTIIDGSFSSDIITTPSTVSEILKSASINLGESEFTTIPENKLVSEDIEIHIREPLSINLTLGGEESTFLSKAITVSDLLQEQSISLSGEDYTKPNLDSPLEENSSVQVIRKKTKTEKIEKKIPFLVEKISDNTRTKGEQKIISSGSEGLKEVEYSIVYENDIEVSRTVSLETILEKAKNKKVSIGTKEPEPVVTSNGTGETRSGKATYYFGPTNAASHIYPKGSVIKVTNISNGKSITVTIDDYGGYGNRLVDLRKDHFQQIGNLSTGVLSVTVERLK